MDYKTQYKEELWKVYLVNSESVWEVSTFGNVRNNTEEYIPFVQDGYLKFSKYLVHRAVGESFIKNPENKPSIDHIDGNPLNNHLSNLRWATYSEQQENSKRLWLLSLHPENASLYELKLDNIEYDFENAKLTGLTKEECEKLIEEKKKECGRAKRFTKNELIIMINKAKDEGFTTIKDISRWLTYNILIEEYPLTSSLLNYYIKIYDLEYLVDIRHYKSKNRDKKALTFKTFL